MRDRKPSFETSAKNLKLQMGNLQKEYIRNINKILFYLEKINLQALTSTKQDKSGKKIFDLKMPTKLHGNVRWKINLRIATVKPIAELM